MFLLLVFYFSRIHCDKFDDFLSVKSTDRLSVITYDTNVYVDFRLLTMTKENKSKCSQLVKNIRSGSSTNLSGGLMKGLSQIIHRDANKNEVASVLLFTDGLANAGELPLLYMIQKYSYFSVSLFLILIGC